MKNTLRIAVGNAQGVLSYRVLFEKVQQRAIAFGFQLFVGDKAQGSTVDAVTYTVGGFVVTGKNMSQMRITAAAAHLGAYHTIACILAFD